MRRRCASSPACTRYSYPWLRLRSGRIQRAPPAGEAFPGLGRTWSTGPTPGSIAPMWGPAWIERSSRYGWRGVLSLGMLVPGLTRAGGALCQGAWAAGIFPSRARHAVASFGTLLCPYVHFCALAELMETRPGLLGPCQRLVTSGLAATASLGHAQRWPVGL